MGQTIVDDEHEAIIRPGERLGVLIQGREVLLPPELGYLTDGDIVRLSPVAGEISVLFRAGSKHNTILTTERCNSWCLMCSQPPKNRDDSYLVEMWLNAIRLMPPTLRELGFSGGEPTLLGENFLRLLQACREHLPNTAVHVLTNGRLFRYLSLARAVSSIAIDDLMLGIPLYGPTAELHDYVVQAKGAFDETVRGMMNLARCEVPVELRIVLQRSNFAALPELARFISRNLPFASHVAIMGLERIGFGKTNWSHVFVDPFDCQTELEAAVEELARAGLHVSLYNFQLCLLPKALRAFAVQSISDWKREFRSECATCSARDNCCGFFFSTRESPSRGIRPIEADPK